MKHEEEASDVFPKVHIAVLGSTGAGKSTFINRLASQTIADEGSGLNSCTREITRYQFELDGRKGIIFDTPGFDDTYKSDAEVLEEIAKYLESTYRDEFKLTAILYLHDIRELRVKGSQMRTIGFFHKLCGKDSLKNVVIVTTKWDSEEQSTAEAREKQLFKEHLNVILASHARTARHGNTTESAEAIIRGILDNETTTTKLQYELVEEEKPLRNTEAGQAVNHDLTKRLQDLERCLTESKELLEKVQQGQVENAALKESMQAEHEKLKEEVSTLKSQKEKLEACQANNRWKDLGVKLIYLTAELSLPYLFEKALALPSEKKESAQILTAQLMRHFIASTSEPKGCF